MTASRHMTLGRLLTAFALLLALLGIASCGGGGSADSGGVSGAVGNGGSDASPGATDGGGDASSGSGGIGGSGDASAGSGGIGGSGGTAGEGGGSSGTADGGSGAGSGGGIGGTGSPSTAGTIHFYLADAPACGYDAVFVTVQTVRIHASATAGAADPGWAEVAVTPPKRLDLLTLTNGVFADLGQTSLPAGKYTQVRLVLADNDAANPLANAVVPTGSAATALQTPSGSQTGIRVDADVDVPAGTSIGLVLDFDACKSVVKRGNSGLYNLKPVISAVPLASDVGLRVTGYVSRGIASASTKVSVQVGGVPVRSTFPDPSGRFVLYPVPPGAYDLVVTAAGRTTAVLTGVPATTTEPTTVGSASVPIDPPAATLRTLFGTVNAPSASVRALQTLSGGKTIEVGWAPVDATTGAFSVELPLQSTVRARYVPNAASMTFVADPEVAGNYTLEAALGTSVSRVGIDANSWTLPVVLTLP